jgi:hypothetical protein
LILFVRNAVQAAVLAAVVAAVEAQAPPPAGFPGQAPAGPAADIVRFEATPSAIAAGQSVTLHWEALNTYSLEIEPAIGVVPTRGSRTVAPSATTTYTLTVTGTGGRKTASTTVTVTGSAAPARATATSNGTTTPANAAAAGAPGTVEPLPKLANGRPDLSGVYLGGRDIRLAGEVAVKPGAEDFRAPVRPDDLGQGAQCLPPGVPGATLSPYPLQIVHKEDLLVILYEAYNIFRVIPIGREHSEDLDPTWLGNSVAHWDGDTLVVDVVGFNDKTLVAGFRHTEDLHVVERYRRDSFGAIAYEATVEDPHVFATPLKYTGNLVLHPEWEIGEYICAENNKTYEWLQTPRPAP